MTRKTTLLGKHLREERERRGLTVEQLAEILGVSTYTVQRLELGKTKGADCAVKIAEAVTKWLGITPEQAWKEIRTEAEIEVGK